MVHHLIKEIDQKNICPYCGINLQKVHWNCEMHVKIHYHTVDCECGKKIRRKIDFITHNFPSTKNKTKSIDGVIRTINEFKEIKKTS